MAPMDVATTFLPLLQVFASEMTRPTFQTFLILVSGWLAAPHRTILGIVRASGTQRHHAPFHGCSPPPPGQSIGSAWPSSIW